MKRMFEMMANAQEEPSEKCSDGKDHDFQTIMHTDGRESFTWYFQCTHCKEVIKKTTKRTGEDKDLWAE